MFNLFKNTKSDDKFERAKTKGHSDDTGSTECEGGSGLTLANLNALNNQADQQAVNRSDGSDLSIG